MASSARPRGTPAGIGQSNSYRWRLREGIASTLSTFDRGFFASSSPGAPAPLGASARPRGRSTAFAHDQQFERIVVALQDAALRDAAWLRALALIDNACGMHSSHLAVVAADAGSPATEYLFGVWRGHGASLDALAGEYVEDYFATDERVPRLLLMPAGSFLCNADLFTEDECATSPTYNQFLPRWDIENQLSARLPALDGSHLLWTVSRSRAQGEWRPSHLGVLARLLPHVGGAVRVRQALAKADARAAALAPLLDAPPQSVILIDRFGRVAQTNARAQRLLEDGRLLRERDGLLRATAAAADGQLRELLSQALPQRGRTPRSGAIALNAAAQVTLRVKPVAIDRLDFGARRIAAVATVS